MANEDNYRLTWPATQNPIFIVAALVLLIVFAASMLLLVGVVWSSKVYQSQGGLGGRVETAVDAPVSELKLPVVRPPAHRQRNLPIPVILPSGAASTKIGALKQALADCDADAAKKPDDLFFLITPVVPANFEAATSLWPPSADNFGAFFLIPSQALLIGLENGFLELSTRPYEFSTVDTRNRRIQTWSPANGPSKFAQANAADVREFQIGFDLGGKGLTWTGGFDRQKGNCYWVNLRLPGQPYSPSYGTVNLAASKSFPKPADTIHCANRVCEPIDQ